MPTDIKTFKQFANNNVFVETGSYLGDGIQMACDAGFKKIISIEISEQFCKNCSERFKDVDRVRIVQGDSSDILGDVIGNINEPITFWLDGHYSGGDLPKGKYLSPLIQELEYIRRHPINIHTILIDDVWCWRDMDNKYHNGFNVDFLVKSILEINSNYEILFIDGVRPGKTLRKDILVAKI